MYVALQLESGRKCKLVLDLLAAAAIAPAILGATFLRVFVPRAAEKLADGNEQEACPDDDTDHKRRQRLGTVVGEVKQIEKEKLRKRNE